MPMISKPEMELSMGNSNRENNIQRAQIDIYMSQYKQHYRLYKEKRLGNFATNSPRSDEVLGYPERIPQIVGNSEILQRMESTIIQASNKEDRGIPCQKKGGKKGRSPSSF
ncbi:hypothetical protein O181_112541 [Austropuccinia psidii MF-1]|uniref:Uncharacterized protein n=1 Tax=Austropuccinia psidii MF-1 TaxID=1389203 RepID=A0A9Q3PTN1_9BASI|nr:hypothetical protein [Austropuccinia psidii MF-1]